MEEHGQGQGRGHGRHKKNSENWSTVTIDAGGINKADRHKSRAPSNQFPTDRQTDRPTEWLIKSRARD